MKQGWRLLRHAVWQVLGNWGAALKISVLLIVAGLAVQWWVLRAFTLDAIELQQEVSHRVGKASLDGAMFLNWVAWSIVTLWIAVAWHRFVLRGEHPRWLLPRLRPGKMLLYLWRLVWLSLLVGLPAGIAVAVFVSVSSILAHSQGPIMIAGLVLFIPLIVLFLATFYRVAVLLPAAALGEKLRLRDAWALTRGQSAALATLGLLLAVGGSVLFFAGEALSALHIAVLSGVWMAVSYWLKLMVGVSVLTTIYGHYIEHRPLRA